MKKILSFLLVAVMLLALCACAGQNAPQSSNTPGTTVPAAAAGGFQAGFGMANITPEESVPMNGFASSTERMSTGFLSYLYAIAIAMTDAEGNTAVVVSVDHAAMADSICNEIRQWASDELGIPQANMILSSIHQHSCPDPINSEVPSSARYRTLMVQGIQDAITQALEDRAPAELYINTATTNALSFVRHYWTNDGTICGDNYGSAASGLVRHESESDKEMRLVKFAREEKEDIILVNFQAHPHMGASANYNSVHADWPGVLRDTVGQALDAKVIYFSGAGGNLNSNSRITTENITTDFKEHGKRAAQYVIDADSSYTKINAGTIKCKEVTITYDADHSMDHLLPQASVVAAARGRSSAEAQELVKNYPELHSIYHASAIVGKAALGPTRDMTISVITLGDLAFTSHPYEMFDTNGMELRAGTIGNENYQEQLENPFKMTIIASLSNGTHGYVPSQMGYTNGGYSTDITKFAPGTGERLVTDYLKLLNELHG